MSTSPDTRPPLRCRGCARDVEIAVTITYFGNLIEDGGKFVDIRCLECLSGQPYQVPAQADSQRPTQIRIERLTSASWPPRAPAPDVGLIAVIKLLIERLEQAGVRP